jgi:NAD(P)-dependent dehydrogenase (short-subunit alcohol dehydrogenase family)
VELPESPTQAEHSIAQNAEGLDLVINCAGILHDSAGMQPERRLREARPENLARSFAVNASGALLVAQAMEPLLRRGQSPLFASLSARVGSIEDNRLGGWYAYRASKAALNMFMRTLAIEWSRGSRPIRVVCLHPGTVATELSAPFVGPAGNRQIFSPAVAADQLLDVLAGMDLSDSGNFYAWDSSSIPW